MYMVSVGLTSDGSKDKGPAPGTDHCYGEVKDF